MPTLNPRARYPSDQTRIPIPTLSGGVGRQAPTKRAVNEAQNLDNILVTLERSAEKRPGSTFLRRFSNSALTTLDASSPNTSELDLHDKSLTADYKFFWFQVAETQRYLVAINHKSEASAGSPSGTELANYMQVFKVTKDGFLECGLSGHNTAAFFNYFTYKAGNALQTADDALSSITIGPQLLVNNSTVNTGYTSKLRTFTEHETLGGVATDHTAGDSAWCKIGLDGEFITTGAGTAGSPTDYTEDINGRKLVYFTTTPVDTEGQGSIYVDGKFFVKNDQVFVSVPSGTDLAPYLKREVTGSGTIKFGAASNGNQTYTVSAEEIPNSLADYGVDQLVVDHNPSDNNETITLRFTGQTERDAFAGTNTVPGLTRFTLAGVSLPLEDGVNNSVITNGTDGAKFTIKWTATASGDGLTVGLVADAVKAAYDAGSSVPFTVPFDFIGTFNPDGSTLPASISDYVLDYSGGDLRTNQLYGNAYTLVFTALRDGTSNSTLPSTAVAAASSEAFFTLRSDDDGGAIAKHIPVQDWRYPDSTRRYLGNQLSDFSEFNFPPRTGENTVESDGYVENVTFGGVTRETFSRFNQPPVLMEDKVKTTLAALYSDLSNGNGKIYYVENSYAGEVPGYYIVKDVTNTPYTRLVRTPEEYSVLDEDRFPKIIKIGSFSNGIEQFVVQNMDLEERRSGNITTNPGPEAFKDGKQAPIKSMGFFRDRLFLSSGDTVFSSRTGDFSDFWAENPSIVADTDPIDVRLSTNKYAEVESMTPFASSLFINTGSDIQFTLKGSENNITPFTAEVSPTAFYSTSPLVNPVLLGSQIYFFAPERAYVYFNDSTVTVNQAIEVSLNCPNYLPKTYGEIAVVPGYDSLCMIDKDNRKFLYVYTNRYRGADVVQNAFYRYVYDVDIMTVESYDNDFYLVSRHLVTGSPDTYRYYLDYQRFYEEDNSVPRLDHQVTIDEAVVSVGSPNHQEGSIVYNAGTGKTTITVKKYGNRLVDTLYIAPGNSAESRAGEIIQLAAGKQTDVVDSLTWNDGTLTIVLIGDFTTGGANYRKFIIGTSYTSTIELSPQYMRDQSNNVVEGTLSLRTLHLQHHNTGTYRIEKATRGRRKAVLTYTPSELDEVNVADADDLPLPLYEKNGESFTKIMGYAAETDLFIVSDYPNPMNIAQIELKGRFTSKTSGFVR